MTAELHSRFGGSVAARVLRCPGSVGRVEKVPAYLRKSSSYAERGSALHAAMTLLLDDDAPSVDSLRGEIINNYAITADDVELALKPTLTYVAALLDRPGAEFYLEQRVVFPTIANTFGTADLIARIGSTIHIVDYKFGSGVPVRALTPDGNEDVLNSQLMFYGVGARHTVPGFFVDVETIVLTIVQPVSIEMDAEMVSSVEVTNAELDEFIAVYRDAYIEALSPTPRLEKGPHCRFCAARPICPEHSGPLLDLTQFALPTPAAAPSKEAYLQLLANGLDLIDAIKDIRTALHDQAKRALDNGDIVPGFVLSAGRAERHWRDDEPTTIAALEHLGLSREDVIEQAIRSVKQVEIRAKARGTQSSTRNSKTRGFDALRHIADARRERTRSGARTERSRAVFRCGTRKLPKGGTQFMSTKEPDPGHDREPDHEPDSGPDNAPDNGRAVARAPTGGALTSLQALAAALANVDTSSITRRSLLPMLSFKREDGGVWLFGRQHTVVEDGSHWVVNPWTFMHGFVRFDNNKKAPDECLTSASANQPLPAIEELPNKPGLEWQEQRTVQMKCISGTDAGREMVFKTSTVGGIDTWKDLLAAVRDWISSGQHGGNVLPIVLLEKDSYQHGVHGRVWFPVLRIIDWMPLEGPVPAAAPAAAPTPASPPPVAQPRRRRVG